MTIRTSCLTILIALLGTTVAGCDGSNGSNDVTANNGADDAVEMPAPAPEATPSVEPKSIIRDDVGEEAAIPSRPEPEAATIGFGDRGMALDDTARAELDRLIDTAAMKAGGPIALRGHSDSRGSDGDNLVASRKRAEAVRDYLVGKGIAADRISVIALGEARPIAPNSNLDGSDDPVGRAKNRRVDMSIDVPPVPDTTSDDLPAAPATAAASSTPSKTAVRP